jgi:hypothetical protein
MADLGRSVNVSGRGALADAAERLDRVARVVKDQQLAETRSGPRIALNDVYIASPEEAWAKKFMTQAIGPAALRLEPPAAPFCQADLARQGLCSMQPEVLAAEPVPPVRTMAVPEVRPAQESPRGPIGGAIGKPPRKRGLFRFFGRR